MAMAIYFFLTCNAEVRQLSALEYFDIRKMSLKMNQGFFWAAPCAKSRITLAKGAKKNM